MEFRRVSEAVIRRMPKYYRQLQILQQQGVERISSGKLAQMMRLNASQVRQDFNCFGGFGQQGYGYNVNSLRLDSLIKKERSLASEAELNRRISLLTDKERNNIIGRHIAANRESFGDDRLLCSVCRPSGVTADDVIKAVRAAKERGAQSIAFFYSGSISHGAETQAYGIDDMPLEFISLRRILSAEDLRRLTPTRDEADALVIAAAEESRRRHKASISAALSPNRTRRYILSAASLTAISFFVENSVYFRITAAACILMGATAWWTNRASA